jgi:hypothetical protein
LVDHDELCHRAEVGELHEPRLIAGGFERLHVEQPRPRRLRVGHFEAEAVNLVDEAVGRQLDDVLTLPAPGTPSLGSC